LTLKLAVKVAAAVTLEMVVVAAVVELRLRAPAGLTVQSISQSSQGGQKDSSGTATTYSVVLSVSALADWELHKPLVNRVDDIEVDFTPISFQTEFQVMGEVTAFGQSQFTPAYM
jgi:D-aminopeptidase